VALGWATSWAFLCFLIDGTSGGRKRHVPSASRKRNPFFQDNSCYFLYFVPNASGLYLRFDLSICRSVFHFLLPASAWIVCWLSVTPSGNRLLLIHCLLSIISMPDIVCILCRHSRSICMLPAAPADAGFAPVSW